MSSARLADLLAQFALANPDRPLSSVTAIEFAAWYARRDR